MSKYIRLAATVAFVFVVGVASFGETWYSAMTTAHWDAISHEGLGGPIVSNNADSVLVRATIPSADSVYTVFSEDADISILTIDEARALKATANWQEEE